MHSARNLIIRCTCTWDGKAVANSQHSYLLSVGAWLPARAQGADHRARRYGSVSELSLHSSALLLRSVACSISFFVTLLCRNADGTLRFWEVDTGHRVASLTHHRGWVTDVLYWYKYSTINSEVVSVGTPVLFWRKYAR